jgi:hypothetical protein
VDVEAGPASPPADDNDDGSYGPELPPDDEEGARFFGGGMTAAQAFSSAQGMAEESNDGSLTVTGRLDTERYGALLPARGLVGVRGAGWSHDGLYHVKQVTHSIARGRHTQEFTLTREGVGSTTPVVRP